MDDLVAFLRARIGEDEAVADGLFFACRGPGPLRFMSGYGGPAADAFIAHFDPARVLREVAFKRTLLELHLPDEYGCQRCEEPGFMCRTLLELAVVYSGHPDYRAEWKP